VKKTGRKTMAMVFCSSGGWRAETELVEKWNFDESRVPHLLEGRVEVENVTKPQNWFMKGRVGGGISERWEVPERCEMRIVATRELQRCSETEMRPILRKLFLTWLRLRISEGSADILENGVLDTS
jgi:hypothetical protein